MSRQSNHIARTFGIIEEMELAKKERIWPMFSQGISREKAGSDLDVGRLAMYAHLYEKEFF